MFWSNKAMHRMPIALLRADFAPAMDGVSRQMSHNLFEAISFLAGLLLIVFGATPVIEHAFGGMKFSFWQLALAIGLLISGIFIFAKMSGRSRRQSQLSRQDAIGGRAFASGVFAFAGLAGMLLSRPLWLTGIYVFGALVNAVDAWQHSKQPDALHPGVFRLNIGISKPTYRSLFGPQPARPSAGGVVDTGHDFTALDRLLPHPVYGWMSWVSVLNPSAATFNTVKPLLAEAYDLAVGKFAKRAARG